MAPTLSAGVYLNLCKLQGKEFSNYSNNNGNSSELLIPCYPFGPELAFDLQYQIQPMLPAHKIVCIDVPVL